MRSICAREERDRLFRIGVGVHVRVVAEHVNRHGGILRRGDAVVNCAGRVVDLRHAHADGCLRGAAFSVGHGVGEAVRTREVLVGRIANLAEDDQRRTVRRVAYGINAERIAVGQVVVVRQNVDLAYAVFRKRRAVVLRYRRVVLCLNRNVELPRHFLSARVFHTHRNDHRAAGLVGGGRDVKTDCVVRLVEHNRLEQRVVIRGDQDGQFAAAALRVRNRQRDVLRFVFFHRHIAHGVKRRRGGDGDCLERGVARVVACEDGVRSADANRETTTRNRGTTRGKVFGGLFACGIEEFFDAA